MARKDQSVLLGLPCYNGFVSEALFGIAMPSRRGRLTSVLGRTSLLALNFNRLWCNALNERESLKLTHFAMIHNDIAAPMWWIDTLIDEMDRVDADIISAVVALKDGRGLTSTAIGEPVKGDIRRLTLHEIHQFPVTFQRSDITDDPNTILLLNTGCWVCRFTEPWVEEAKFQVLDDIRRSKDGTFQAVTLSEDWNFSRWAAARSLKMFATRVVAPEHYGMRPHRSDIVWGTCQVDPGGDEVIQPGVTEETPAEAKGNHDDRCAVSNGIAQAISTVAS